MCFSKPQSLLVQAKDPVWPPPPCPAAQRCPGAKPCLPTPVPPPVRAPFPPSTRLLLAGLSQLRVSPPPGRRSVQRPAQAGVQAPRAPTTQ